MFHYWFFDDDLPATGMQPNYFNQIIIKCWWFGSRRDFNNNWPDVFVHFESLHSNNAKFYDDC